jgi:hypothetical protein
VKQITDSIPPDDELRSRFLIPDSAQTINCEADYRFDFAQTINCAADYLIFFTSRNRSPQDPYHSPQDFVCSPQDFDHSPQTALKAWQRGSEPVAL